MSNENKLTKPLHLEHEQVQAELWKAKEKAIIDEILAKTEHLRAQAELWKAEAELKKIEADIKRRAVVVTKPRSHPSNLAGRP